MVDTRNVSHVINPVTALTLVTFQSKLLLLVGEGPYLKVFDHESTQLVCSVVRVLESQSIHGISCINSDDERNDISTLDLLIWGGRCCRVGHLQRGGADSHSEIKVSFGEEVLASDWILDACLRLSTSTNEFLERNDAILVTAHNVALALPRDRVGSPVSKRIAIGPKSLLYSACVEWTVNGTVLIASGTVFGEVLLWSFPESPVDANTNSPVASRLHYKFTAHEGSVFGVSISPDLPSDDRSSGKRMLASCSDDRTIRIWDISAWRDEDALQVQEPATSCGLEFSTGESRDVVSRARCIATVMGHASRIWNVRFLASKDSVHVVSFGEDRTAHLWELIQKVATKSPPRREEDSSGQQLVHRYTYTYHFGKNVWASAIMKRRNESYTICTGGADGRVVSYDLLSSGEGVLHTSQGMDDVATQLDPSRALEVNDVDKRGTESEGVLTEQIFDALKGRWSIKRHINSFLPSYPSGTFIGETTIGARPPSDDSFDKEYLYTEQGTFSADQGLSFAATRQYVYRYQRASATISAWFVKPDADSAVDYLFHELLVQDFTIVKNEFSTKPGSLVKATGYHLCVDDHYTPEYAFRLEDDTMKKWKLTYQVKGPQKDYVSEATYSRKDEKQNQTKERILSDGISSISQTQNGHFYVPNNSGLRNDDFKSYVFLTSKNFMATTVQGRILIGSFTSPRRPQASVNQSCMGSLDVEWKIVGHFKELKSSSMTTKVVASDMVLVTGHNGTVFRYDILTDKILPVFDLGRKIAFFYAQKLSTEEHVVLATCLGVLVAHIYMHKFGRGSSDHNRACHSMLVLPPSFIATSACYVEASGVWLLGSRNGTMALYDAPLPLNDTRVHPYKLLRRVHGEDAITVIQCFSEPRLDPSAHILTAGRDGHYAVHMLTTDRSVSEQLEINFNTVHRSTPPFGPNIEGAAIDLNSQTLLLWGFRSKNFVVWNASQNKETLNIECGGAHRNWSYLPYRHYSGGGNFVWTKASMCCLHSQTHASHRVLQPGGHGREIKAMAASPTLKAPDGSMKQYIATGAEDTAIRIWSYGSDVSFSCLGTFTKHTTGIQKLLWSKDGQRLFSAAGCEELFTWRVQPVPLVGIGAMCEAVCPTVTEDGDLRVMDFCLEEQERDNHFPQEGKIYIISVVYSDSSVRIFHYSSSSSTPQFTIRHTGTYTTNCLTQILSFPHPTVSLPHEDTPSKYLCTASTNGHIAFWPLSPPPNPDTENPTTFLLLHPTHHHRIHQNAIKSLTSIPLLPPQNPQTHPHNGKSPHHHHHHLLLSGGDDGALGITLLTLPPLPSPLPLSPSPAAGTPPTTTKLNCQTTLIPTAHAAAVNAVVYIRTLTSTSTTAENEKEVHIFASSGDDQKLKIWGISLSGGGGGGGAAAAGRKEAEEEEEGKGGVEVTLKEERWTSVAGVEAIAALGTTLGEAKGAVVDDVVIVVVVAGIGMEGVS
ncbi:MAG: hypothetical protein Q9219_007084 [cf. Caloplaca sp. 3 TL-2023]